MPLHDLIKPLPGSTAPDRALYNDQYDLKIDNLTTEVIAVCDAVDGMFTAGAPPTGAAGGGLTGIYLSSIFLKPIALNFGNVIKSLYVISILYTLSLYI